MIYVWWGLAIWALVGLVFGVAMWLIDQLYLTGKKPFKVEDAMGLALCMAIAPMAVVFFCAAVKGVVEKHNVLDIELFDPWTWKQRRQAAREERARQRQREQEERERQEYGANRTWRSE
jgi:hypothetical protein